jgi:hypothetical protein
MVFNLLDLSEQQKTRIDQHLVRIHWATNVWTPLPIVPEQLRLPAVRRTIDEVIEAFEKFKQKEPEHAKRAGL